MACPRPPSAGCTRASLHAVRTGEWGEWRGLLERMRWLWVEALLYEWERPALAVVGRLQQPRVHRGPAAGAQDRCPVLRQQLRQRILGALPVRPGVGATE